jgi:hypothetical protein
MKVVCDVPGFHHYYPLWFAMDSFLAHSCKFKLKIACALAMCSGLMGQF